MDKVSLFKKTCYLRIIKLFRLYVCVCVCVCVRACVRACVCARARERERQFCVKRLSVRLEGQQLCKKRLSEIERTTVCDCRDTDCE